MLTNLRDPHKQYDCRSSQRQSNELNNEVVVVVLNPEVTDSMTYTLVPYKQDRGAASGEARHSNIFNRPSTRPKDPDRLASKRA